MLEISLSHITTGNILAPRRERVCPFFLPLVAFPHHYSRPYEELPEPLPVSTYHLVRNQHPILDTKFCSVINATQLLKITIICLAHEPVGWNSDIKQWGGFISTLDVWG